jgi:DNA-binding ferritin-like protein
VGANALLCSLEVVRDLEKQLWMLRASLPAGTA